MEEEAQGGGGGGITISTASTPPSPPPVGSPEVIAELPQPSDEHLPLAADEHQPRRASGLTDDLRDKIIKQVEYYFSDENLQTDNFLMSHISKDKDGFVPIGFIASFKKLKKLTKDKSLIVAALRQSTVLVVSASGKNVRRIHPLPFTEVRDPKTCTVLVENLPAYHSKENLKNIFGVSGNIKNIRINIPNAIKEPKKLTVDEKFLSGKLHALVEYETVEAAEKAAATLNDEKDWRYGMRVKLLKAVAKHGQRKKAWKESESEKINGVLSSDPMAGFEEHSLSDDNKPDKDNGEHLAKDKNEQKDRNRGQARRQKYRISNGHGYGSVSSGHIGEPSKPPPGPKMPDGTRGFTMGRGRILPCDQN
jgi:La-related protein 7